jgi:hypothetical protein
MVYRRLLSLSFVFALGIPAMVHGQSITPATGDGFTVSTEQNAITIGSQVLTVGLIGGAVIDSAGNLLVFNYTANISILKPKSNARTQVTLVPYGNPLVKATHEYPFSFASVVAGSKAVYGFVTADTILDPVTKSHTGLVALSTSDGKLPDALQPIPIDSAGELKVVPAASTSPIPADLIYVIQSGRTMIKALGGLSFEVVTLKKSVHLFLFDGSSFQDLGEVTLP